MDGLFWVRVWGGKKEWFLPPGQILRAVELTAPQEVVQLQRHRDLERTGRVEQSLRRVLELLDVDGEEVRRAVVCLLEVVGLGVEDRDHAVDAPASLEDFVSLDFFSLESVVAIGDAR